MLNTRKLAASFVKRKYAPAFISSLTFTSNHQIMNFKFTHQAKSDIFEPDTYFPYGTANFQNIRKQNRFYVDKTHHIPLLEKVGEQLFLVRPPRWGKSLLLTMLECYYDVIYERDFQTLFGNLWIGEPKNQTKLKNQYHVLRLDFSIEASPENIQQALYNSINGQIEDFLNKHGFAKEKDNIISENDALYSFDRLVNLMVKRKLKLMVLVDEYDRFANKLMFESPEKYKLFVAGKSGEPTSSPIRAFFERLKRADTKDIGFRSLVVGITPIALADASGYNVATNISLAKEFGDLVGFTETDLRLALKNIGITNDHQNTTISLMKRFYNGYHFPGVAQPLFNPTLSTFFLRNIARDNSFRRDVLEGKDIPLLEMKDDNTEISDNVFKTLASSPVSTQIIRQAMVDSVEINSGLATSLKLRDIIDPPTPGHTATATLWDNALSFMYYHGMLTFKNNNTGLKTLTIPNELIRQQYFGRLIAITELNQNAILQVYKNPSSPELLFYVLRKIIGEKYNHFDNTFSEMALQHSLYCVLEAYCKLQCPYFKVSTEDSVTEEDQDFNMRTDIRLEGDKDIIIIELKRVRPNAVDWNVRSVKQLLAMRAKRTAPIPKKEYARTLDDIGKTIWLNSKTAQRINEGLDVMSDKELLNLPLNAWILRKCKTYSNAKTVKDVMDIATQQLRNYVQQVKKTTTKPIHSYVVVQVGTPIIVKPVAN